MTILQVWCTPQRARAIVVVVCFAAAIVTMPEFFEAHVVEMYEAASIPVVASDVGSVKSETTSRMSFATEYNSSADTTSFDENPSALPAAATDDGAANRVVRLIAKQTEFGASAAYSTYRYVNQALFTFVPLVLLLVFNTLLISAVLTAARRRQSMAKTGRRDTNAAAERQDRQRRGQQKITVRNGCLSIFRVAL